MKITNFFLPEQMPEGITDRERLQMPYFTLVMLIITMFFLLLCVVQIILGEITESILMALGCLTFVGALFFIKKGNFKVAILCGTVGLLYAEFIVAVVMSVESSPFGLYRIAAFLYVMIAINSLVCVQLRGILIFGGFSIGIWILGVFFGVPQISEDGLSQYYVAAFVGGLGMICEIIILFFMCKIFKTLNSNIVAEKERVQITFSKITTVLSESQQKLEVGNTLSKTTTTANADAIKMTETFLMLKNDAGKLSQTANTMLKANSIVEQRSEGMRSSTQAQNAAITQSSAALTEISANLTNINEIASHRRKKMNDLLKLLKGQKNLVQQALVEVKRVKESSNTIGTFIHTVEDIANQTGLLAMNASIEAAHAGSAGKGFAVIAQEIRKLSEETAKNAAHIGDALKTNEQTVEVATNSVITFASQAEQSTDELQTTLAAIEEILMGISEMDIGTREVMNSMQHIVETSRQNGNLVDEVSEKISEQRSAVSEISDFAKKFQGEIERTNKQLENIQYALENIQKTADLNKEVSSSMNTELGKIGV